MEKKLSLRVGTVILGITILSGCKILNKNNVVINPDNPSGNYIPKKDVLRLIDWAGNKGIRLIIDESFVDF